MGLEFAKFPSIARLSREMVVTEKIDGTNASIHIVDVPNLGGEREPWPSELEPYVLAEKDGMALFAGSRTRYVAPIADNFGFAAWAKANADELFKLGYGQHFGEWWGAGIQRRYGLDHKRFSLFNVARWTSDMNDAKQATSIAEQTQCREVPCCYVVPVLLRYTFDTAQVDAVLANIAAAGSFAAPGFMQPEGVVVYHTRGDVLFKKTLDKHDGHKAGV